MCMCMQVHEKESGEVDLLTKGDNNAVDDRGLYAGVHMHVHMHAGVGAGTGPGAGAECCAYMRA